MKRLALFALLAPLPLAAQDAAGTFDYYVLSLSWSPSWCATERQERDAAQCQKDRRVGFVVHGLWPQHERGWPDWCETRQPDPSRRESRAMEDIMGSAGLAWYQWQKHGRCSGLPGRAYYQTIRKAAGSVQIPPVLRLLPRDVRMEAAMVEDAFLDVNPGLTRDGITVTCDEGRLDEVRICLTRGLQPRACAPDVRRDCRSRMLVEAPG